MLAAAQPESSKAAVFQPAGAGFLLELRPGTLAFLREQLVRSSAQRVEKLGVHEPRQHQVPKFIELSPVGFGQHVLRVPPW